MRTTSLLYWALQLAGWSFYFYAQASGEVIFASATWGQTTALWGAACVAGILLTQGFRWTAKRRGWLALSPTPLFARVAAATLLLAAMSHLLVMTLSRAVYGTPVAPIMGSFYERLGEYGQLRNQFIASLALYAAWVTLYMAFATQRRRHQLAEQLQATELRLLKSQLNPHFLFNALNGLRSLIADDPARARDAVTYLSRTLRYTLASGDEDLVSLERELEMVEDYLALESMRLAERLRVEREIEPAARTSRVPAMLLQTLVENAIKHGIAELKEGGTLRIEARVTDQLRLTVTNPRPLSGSNTHGEGLGIKNSTERLRLLFGARASLRLDLSQPGVAIAEATMPK
ncbi:MAG: histidine kinase [Steroidobacteraceae bacterium]|nr:histidine kinase [Steroidobacteraceae bacterium]